jgi:nitrile hydratase
MSNHQHDHDHDQDHDHHFPTPASYGLLDRLVNALVSKGIVSITELEQTRVETEKGNPQHGAKMVVKAWLDLDYKNLLLRDGVAAAEAIGHSMVGAPPLGVLENTPEIHHMIVCTLCSCYPRKLLGYPPDWYKSSAYRARAVRNPRSLLDEWGIKLQPQTEIRVVDSTADYRWMVLPMRPSGTENLTEEELVKLVNRDCLVGAGLPDSKVD